MIFQAAQVCQTIKSKVVLVKEDFILVSLKGHAMGQLAYLPSKRVCIITYTVDSRYLEVQGTL